MKHIPMVKPIMGFQKRPKDGAESTGLVDINEVKHSQRHLLATIENNRLVSQPVNLAARWQGYRQTKQQRPACLYLFKPSNGHSLN